jgi:hypothetical protein
MGLPILPFSPHFLAFLGSRANSWQAAADAGGEVAQ